MNYFVEPVIQPYQTVQQRSAVYESGCGPDDRLLFELLQNHTSQE